MNRQAVILSNKTEYGEKYHQIKFVDKEKAKRYSLLRSNLIDSVTQKTTGCAGGTKIYSGELSPGCRHCVEGRWSCLFINNICNAGCFYCPASQDDLSLPSTNNIVFQRPEDYVAYLDEFGFTGVSFSGGEPLLSFDRTLKYLQAVRKRFGSNIHIWMYTNGILLDHEKAEILAGEGIDEIRFDISANHYRLDKIRHAAGKIPVVTVEIPAVPENIELLKSKVSEMVSEGVNYLNLHQMRLTGHNFQKLTQRDYHFLHGNKVTVAESELTALEIIRHTTDHGISLPVNYCSFVYKNRYQALAARKRYVSEMQEPWEQVSRSGYLRAVFLPGDPDYSPELALSRYGSEVLSNGRNIYFVSPRILEKIDLSEQVTLVYNKVALKQHLSYYFPFKEIRLSSGMKVFLEKQPVFRQSFANSRILARFLNGNSSANSKIGQVAGEFENVPEGLGEYF